MQVKNMLTSIVSSATGTAGLVCFLARMLPCETAQTGGSPQNQSVRLWTYYETENQCTLDFVSSENNIFLEPFPLTCVCV